MDDKVQAEAARVLGMKASEVVDVVKADGGTYVQTHDQSWTFVAADGELTFNVDAPAKRRS